MDRSALVIIIDYIGNTWCLTVLMYSSWKMNGGKHVGETKHKMWCYKTWATVTVALAIFYHMTRLVKWKRKHNKNNYRAVYLLASRNLNERILAALGKVSNCVIFPQPDFFFAWVWFMCVFDQNNYVKWIIISPVVSVSVMMMLFRINRTLIHNQ